VVKRGFNVSWFDSHTWLHYDENKDLAFCYLCMKAVRKKTLITSRCADKAFISTGFSNWKDAKVAFRNHEQTKCHKEAVHTVVVLPREYEDCGELLSSQHALEKVYNRQMMLKLLSNIHFLARQGLPLRGDGEENDSNYNQMLRLRGLDDIRVFDWIKKKSDKYTSPDVQNEMLEVMSRSILHKIISDIQNALFYAIMVDETTDRSNQEQVVLVLRWVDDALEAHEDFIGLYSVSSISADNLTNVIKDCLKHLSLPISKVRSQCYDGASNMTGAKKGVAKQIQDVEKRAIFIHCYGHALNLACGDAIKGCKVLKSALETTREITKLVKFSPKREVLFKEKKQEVAPDTPGIRLLCPTRWTVRGESLSSIVSNYAILQDTFEQSINEVTDTEIKSRIIGVSAQMTSFEYLFGTLLGECILRNIDNLSKTLQNPEMSAAEAQDIVKLTTSTLQSIRTTEMFDQFWQKVIQYTSGEINVGSPKLPRKRKAPRRLEVGCGEPSFAQGPKDLYRRHYFEALDLALEAIRDRFDQNGYKTYKNLQDVLLKAARGLPYDQELKAVLDFYGDDFEQSQLGTQLQHLTTHFKDMGASQKSVSFKDVYEYLKSFSKCQRSFYSQVVVLVTLILVMPATNAGSERSFSALRRIKSYLRSTMSQTRLNSLMVLHVHKELTDQLDLIEVANEFVSNKSIEHRLTVFGKFTERDIVGVIVCPTCGKVSSCSACCK